MLVAKAVDEPAEKPSRFYVPALDGLRTVAFLMVWWSHALPFAGALTSPPLALPVAFRISGAYGVPIFFVLSAFLITRLLLNERERNGRIDIRAYYVRRTLRIWPLYYLIIFITVVDWACHGGIPLAPLASLATFTSNWYTSFFGRVDGYPAVLWSVSVEEQFYLVWPFVIAFTSRRTLKNVSFAMVGLAFLSRIFFLLVLQRGAFPVKDPLYGLWGLTFNHLDSLGLGTLLALGWKRLPRLEGWRWYAAFVGCLAALVVQAQWFPLTLRSTPLDLGVPMGYTLVPVIAVAIVALALTSKETFLEWRPVIALGKITFGMYCFHLIVLVHLHGSALVKIPLSLAITAAVSWLSYNFYEKPFLRLKRRFERIETRMAN